MSNFQTIFEIIQGAHPESPAIGAPDRRYLTFGQLTDLCARTRRVLNGGGIGRNERVAIVLPNGAEMATAFTAISCAATTAPLNPAYRREEFEFYLDDLNARALVVEAGSDSPAVAAARELGIRICYLHGNSEGAAGDFELECPSTEPKSDGPVQPDDVALILHTSGTTSRPKIVPLSHRNVSASAHNIMRSLSLTEHDRCLNIMPLFHIHGLIAAVLASLRAGASISCSPGFNALKFFGWIDETKPTWYTAVPTMHQAILSRAAKNQNVIQNNPLRFIRSSSSSLSPQVMSELERVFDAPVVEAYGMTEAAHLMACNPLPPGKRIAGTVGKAAGPEVAIMDEDGELLESGSTGEIVIRGDNVTRGYENNPKANTENFTHGWFRTGDQGSIDPDGYISITGRLK
ncbi:MAG: AMP-binding protein, partial [Pseudomonadota bacterium]